MTRLGFVRGALILWLAMGVGMGVHLAVTEPVAQMPVHGFNKVLIAAGWFVPAMVVALVAAIAARGLPKDTSIRTLAFVPLILQALFALVFLAQVFAS